MPVTMYSFLTFDGECREAVKFYEEVFQVAPEMVTTLTFGEVYRDKGEDLGDFENRIIYAEMEVFGGRILFSDCPPFYQPYYSKGTNSIISFALSDRKEIDRLFGALSEGGTVIFGLLETEAVDLLGIVIDKFGVTWQLSLKPKGQSRNPYPDRHSKR